MANSNQNLEDLTIGELFQHFGMTAPKPWIDTKERYAPKTDCFAFNEYLNDKGNRIMKCNILKKLYCKYECDCNFYKHRKGE